MSLNLDCALTGKIFSKSTMSDIICDSDTCFILNNVKPYSAIKMHLLEPSVANVCWHYWLMNEKRHIKKGAKDQESIHSSTTPDPGYHIRKWQRHNYTSQTRAKRSARSQQVTTRQQWTDAKAWQTQDINNTNDPQKKYHLGMVRTNVFFWRAKTGFTASTSPLVQM